MIKVNLAKTSQYASRGTQTSIKIDSGSLRDSEKIISKVALILSFTIIIIFYERYNLNLKTNIQEKVKHELASIEQEIAQYGSVTTIIQDLAKEKEILNEQLLVIQKISQKRAYKLKTILKVQEGIPDDLWLKQLIIDKELVTFKGFSRTPTSVQLVVRRLSESIFVESAINQEMNRVKSGDDELQEFNIEARVKL
jgi:Tfp pilus assembly protein PilN